MNDPSYINIEKSIRTGYLFSPMNRSHIIDRVFFVFLFSAFLFILIILFSHADLNNENNKVASILFLPVALTFCIYGICRVIFENRLISITTSFTQKKNHEILNEFLLRNGYTIIKENEAVIMASIVETISWGNRDRKIATFIIEDSRICFAMRKDYFNSSPPVFFTHVFLKRDLKKSLQGNSYSGNY